MRKIRSVSLALVLIASGCGPAPAPDGAHANMESVEPAPLDPGAPAAEQAALASCGPVSAAGWCGVTFGMTPGEAMQKFPVPLEGYETADTNEPDRCFEMFAAEPVQGVSFLIENRKVGRVDFLTDVAKTAEGFGIGSAGDDIRARFGAAAVEAPNKYEPEVLDLFVTQGATKFVFEIQDGKVRGWRAGVAPTIDYVEHCS